MIKKIRHLAQILVICVIIGAMGCGTGSKSDVTVSIPLDPQQTSISGLKGQIRVSGMSGTFAMTISGTTASVTIPEVPAGARTFTITFFVGSPSDPTIVAEVTVTKNVSADINLQITYAATDFDKDFNDDADGFTNYDEVIAGTDPQNPSDYPSGGGSDTPASPTNLTAIVVSGPAINLAWTDNSNNESGFGLEYSPDGTTWSLISGSVPADTTSYTDNIGIVAGITYYYRVYAYNSYGYSTYYSNVAQVTVPSGGSAWTASSLGAGGYHACAVTSTGGVKCWGDNGNGQLGNGSTTGPQTCTYDTTSLACSQTPVDVSGLSSGISKVVSGGYSTCALTTGGGVKCWGSNLYGQLGNGSTTDSSVPVNVSGLTSGVTDISAGMSHVCAVMSAGGAKCWGNNEYGKLGNGSSVGPQTCNDGTNNIACSQTPVNVSGLTGTVTAVSAGLEFTCVLISGGTIKCWGRNTWGSLGNNSTTDSVYPVSVTGIVSGVTALSSSPNGYYSCAVVSGAVKCWGSNDSGCLGVSSSGPEFCNGSDPCSKSPVNVTSLTTGVSSISTGSSHACALVTGGAVKCWGYNTDGELGNGGTANSYTPVNATGLSSGVAQISMGFFFSCARTTSNALKCWGNNYWGQIGDGTTTQRSTPVDVDMIP